MSINDLMSNSIYNYIDQLEAKEDEILEETIPKSIYKKILNHPSLSRWIKYSIIFYILRIPNPIQWANFITLNKPIRQALKNLNNSKHYFSNTLSIDRISNLITCIFLYFASINNYKLPKDYALISFLTTYHGELNPPSKSQILVIPNFSKYFKISYYKNKSYYSLLKSCYDNKEFVIFPLLFAQLLSNYLTPTKYKLNQRYISPFMKRYILNPIWINFQLGHNHKYLNWLNLLGTYSLQNLILALGIAGISFKSLILDKFYEIKYGKRDKDSESSIIKNYLVYIFHKSNSIINFIYLPNLISMELISLTSPIFKVLNSSKNLGLQYFYLNNQKQIFKNYIKLIGFIAGLITMIINSKKMIPDFGYNKTIAKQYDEYEEEVPKIRYLSKQFFNDLNIYLFKTILLSKWRITKTHHPTFSKIQLSIWNQIETLIMCFGFYKMMNLNDFIKLRAIDKDRISQDYAIKVANFVT
ncbi:uncharacterized protein KGF55_001137 [Candida pseudojiufengensis]|uniref:uncharacterized protein n=1 Tax=Candida pseudojiufengensis TaxID=497109 RepID=UPI002224798A|nr:uncharacterized protein KGF55_001137 [Candida pseudojiufengensis]KAI5965774.1 hypothetical protein KGF55_001137 [Candida pseudojiufengensis]